jgi:hypothetical protein
VSAAHFSLLTQERIPHLNQGAFCLPLPAPVGVARYTRLALGGAGNAEGHEAPLHSALWSLRQNIESVT